MADQPYWQKYDPSASGLIPKERGAWRKFSEYVRSDPMGFLGSKREDRWRPGGTPTPPSRRAALSGMRMLTSHDRREDNAAHEEHARDVAARHRTGETTAAQGDNTPPSGSGGTPTPTPPPPTQSGAQPGGPAAVTRDPYLNRMNAIRQPDGRIVFTNVPGDYVPETGPSAPGTPSRMDYGEAIGELGGSVSTPMELPSGGTAFIQPDNLPTAPLEARPPMTDQQATERGATMAAAEGAGDARSILERRAWTERRLGEQRSREMEEAELAEAEMKAVDPREIAEIESAGRWGSEQLEQVAEAERIAAGQAIIEKYKPLMEAAFAAGDTEAVRQYEQMIRMQLRALGHSVPEPRALGMEAVFGSAIGDTVDEKLEEKKAAKK